MNRSLLILYLLLVIVLSVFWAFLGLYIVVVYARDFFTSMGNTFVALLEICMVLFGLTLVASAILQWSKRRLIRLLTNVFLLVISLVLVFPGWALSATLEYDEMSGFMRVLPFICIVLSVLGVICNSFKSVSSFTEHDSTGPSDKV